MSRRRPLALLAVATITLAACGSETTSTPLAEPADEPATTEATPATDAPAAPAATDAPEAEPAAEPPSEPSADEPATEPATEPAEESATEPAEEPATEPAEERAEEPAPEPTEAPAPEPVGVVDGCSTDGSPTLVESAAGPAPAVEIRPESADSPLIDLAVRRINCAGGWANLRNEVPSDRPILVWFWAPH